MPPFLRESAMGPKKTGTKKNGDEETGTEGIAGKRATAE
jgi:hypothetical protein